jgi:uncharacterized membrane protein
MLFLRDVPMLAALFVLFLASAMGVFVISIQRRPRYNVANAFAAVSWLALILLAIISQGR